MQTPEIIIVFVQNGDAALFVNGRKIYSLDASEAGPSVQDLGEQFADSLGTAAKLVEVAVPKDDDWNWNDVYELLDHSKLQQQMPDDEPVAYWNSSIYKGDMGEAGFPTEFLMELDDRRASSGQLSVTIGSSEGDVDDILDAHFEIGCVPGSRDATQSMLVHFDQDNLAFRLYKQGSKYILSPETDIEVLKTKLADGSQGYIIQ